MEETHLTDIFTIDKPNVCFVGDIHGEFNSLHGLMKKTGFRDTAYIVCGDIGFGFNKKEYYSQVFNRIGRTASKMNCEFIFIRGNHDDRRYFDKRKVNRKCFKTVPDYSVLQTPNLNILCIGGAISIDRKYRQMILEKNAETYSLYHGCSIDEARKSCQRSYWDDEACYYDGERLSQIRMNGIDIDVVCTHTCPSFLAPFDKSGVREWLRIDECLEADMDAERKVMDDVYAKLKEDGHTFGTWVYGHFHFHSVQYHEGRKFVMLDMCRGGNCDIYDIQCTDA